VSTPVIVEPTTATTAPPEPGADVALPTFGFWWRFRRNTVAVVALGYVALLVVVTLIPDVFAPHDPAKIHTSGVNASPSGEYWLGQDDVGRDLFSRLIFATRVSLTAAGASVGMALVVAVPVALAAGYLGRWVDLVVMRVTDSLQAIPALVLALAIRAILGAGLFKLCISLAVIFTPGIIRLVRGQVLAVREETYVEASQSIGARSWYILRKRVFHNIASPLIVQAALLLGQAMLVEASLSFLGLGADPDDPSWGQMVSRAFQFINTESWIIFVPGLAITFAVLAFNLVGDGLRDALGTETRGA
jgi:ABC-type dipeptide/oligopeptide/nickel transport system permease subunit